MTFREAFESGCRFRLPMDYCDNPGWPLGWYWQKKNDLVYVITHNKSYTIWNVFRSTAQKSLYKEYLKSNDWMLHPVDERNMLFKKQLKKELEL